MIRDALRRVSGAVGGAFFGTSVEVPPALREGETETKPTVVDPPERHTRTIPILLLGRLGSSKTKFVNVASASKGIDPESNPVLNVDITPKQIVVSGYKYQLIDTPGFDDPKISNLEVLEKISGYLVDKRRNDGLCGVVYVHYAGDSPGARSTRQIMRGLSEVILGKSFLSRLTILVVPVHAAGSEHSARIATDVEALASSIFQSPRKGEIRTMVSNLEESDVVNILEWYATKDPVRLHIQREPPRDLRFEIEGNLGYFEANSVQLLLDRERDSAARHYRAKLAPIETSLDQHKAALKHYETVNRQLNHELTREREENQSLRQRLQQTQAEYSSLRSQLQLQENTEQSEIVQVLKDLNRNIDDIGRSFAEYLVDKYVQRTFEKDPGDVTTLDARELSALKELFGHVEGQSSLVASDTGSGMMVEDFFDYALRCLLCVHLSRQIFSLFHPGADPAHNTAITIMYDDIQLREPQAVSAKWRANCFKSIYRPATPDATVEHIDRIVHDFFNSNFSVLIQAFFGKEQIIEFEGKHFNQLKQLVQMAWEWNAMLKGEVIVLGDFYQTCYDPNTPFESAWMEEFEPRRGVKAGRILGTLALGLFSTKAVGGGQPPQHTTVCKAVVATQSMYE